LISNKTPWLGLRERNVGYDLPLDEPGLFREALTDLLALKQEAYDKISVDVHNFAEQYLTDPSLLAANRALFS
jgi:hypothetical protein